MADTVGLIKGATEAVLGIGEIAIDNFTFKLFYKWSATLFIASSIAVVSNQFFGDPISCETAQDDVDEEVIIAYCWMYSTFNVPNTFKGNCARQVFDNTSLYNTYYQWVSIFLFIQAILFYIPRCIWLSMEGGLMNFLVNGCTDRVVEDKDTKQNSLLHHYHEHIHNKFNKYAYCFFFCELLNILISVSQIFVTDAFLNYQFLDYGYLVFNYYRLSAEERSLDTTFNPMCEVFPKVGACDFMRYGRGGGAEIKNAICILSLNIINDKVFAVIWFWHCVLIIFGVLRIVLRIVQLCSSSIRLWVLEIQMDRYLANNKHAKHIEHYVHYCSIGDWFLLYQMNKSMNKRFFAEFLALLSMKINPDPHVRADPEIDIFKTEGTLANGDIEDFHNENELEEGQKRLKKKLAWKRKVNIFTGKRHISKKRK